MTRSINNVVLVHGAFADASSWADVITLLQRQGLRVTGVQNPLSSLAEDVAATRRALDAQDGPTILAGHSYGGAVITEAGAHPNVASLVYVAALAPDEREDFGSLASRFAPAPGMAALRASDGFLQFDEAGFVANVAPDLVPERARLLAAVQAPIPTDLLGQMTTQAAWKSKPSFYAVSMQDRIIAPELQRFFAGRMRATTVELAGSHLLPLSHPQEVTALIARATLPGEGAASTQ